ncbi:MAG: class I SAM-dependent methyltransferase [Bacillota bacterium]|nr:class I SAM-dependent methyltransferase [Bacillota bacterium]
MSTINKIFSGGFWEKIWLEAGLLRRGKRSVDDSKGTSAWDKRAGHFNRKVSGEDGSARTNTILKFLREEGALYPGMKIIDVGSGPGSVTMLLAETAGEVYALDPAVKMLTILQEKAREKGINNLHTVQARWQEIDLKAKGWEEAFDLSFASMFFAR